MAVPEHALQLKTFPPPQPEQKYPEGEYQPTLSQFPTQQARTFPTETHPPGCGHAGQTDYHPVTDTSTAATVVTTQPSVVSVVSPPKESHTPVAISALVLSVITMICCGLPFPYLLICTIPALVLAIVAMVTRGKTQKINAGVSIGLSVAVIMMTVVFGIIVGITSVVLLSNLRLPTFSSSRTCYSYYSSDYHTECVPYSGFFRSCVYYPTSNSTGSYCPT